MCGLALTICIDKQFPRVHDVVNALLRLVICGLLVFDDRLHNWTDGLERWTRPKKQLLQVNGGLGRHI